MKLAILTFLTGLSISAVAIYYSVIGLAAIFAAAVIPIVIMGTILELSKLVTAWWLKANWHRAPVLLKTYMFIAVVVLMFITSMGIFGFLSKAHIEQTSAGQESIAQVERIEGEIKRQQDIISRAETQIQKLETSGTGNDVTVQNQIDAEQERIDKAYERIQPAIKEQQDIIDQQAVLYERELEKIDQEMKTLQGYIDNGETKKAQQMIGASADGIFGAKTADKIGEWQEAKQAERDELIDKIKQARNNPQAQAAADEIKRLRAGVEEQIKQSNALINRLRSQLGNEDKAANIDADIDEQNLRIKDANAEIDKLFEEKYTLEGEYRKLEAEVGPIKYIAEFIYGEEATTNLLEEAVRWVIITIIFVFDPLAVLLLIASQISFQWARQEKGGGLPPKSDNTPDPQDDPKPPFTEEEWDEAHRMNYEHDRAKRIDENPGFKPERENDLSMDTTDTDADATVRDMVPENDVSVDDGTDQTVEQVEVQSNDFEKVEPTLSKNDPDQYLLWDDIDPDVKKESEDELVYKKEADQKGTTLGTAQSTEEVDPNQYELDFEPTKEFTPKQDDKHIPNTRNAIFYPEELDLKKKSYVSWLEKEGKRQIRKTKEE